MELSTEVHDLLQRFRTLSKLNEGKNEVESIAKSIKSSSCEMQSTPTKMQDEILNLDDIYFDNDENWLYGTAAASTGSVQNWLYANRYDSRFTQRLADPYVNAVPSHQLDSLGDLSDSSSSAKKIFDSRTYTRPKKKFIRPSIDKYRDDVMEIPTINKTVEKSDFGTPAKALHFDLTQPMTCSRIFDNIARNAPDNDSFQFQNMSPPSLINSMCSSTFTAAMDSSIIRNDPVLREIRSADYKAEPLMLQSLQSLTESYSSINSDSAENYLRRTLPQLLSGKADSSECDENFYSLTGSQAVLDEKLDGDLTENVNDRNLEDYYYDTTKTALNNNTTNMKDLYANRSSLKQENSTIINSETKSFPIDALTGDNKLDYEAITNRYCNEGLKTDAVIESFTKDSKSHSSIEQSAPQSRNHILDATFNKSEDLACDTTFIKSPPNISNHSNNSQIRSLNGTFTRPKKVLSSIATFGTNDTFSESRPDNGDYYNTNEQVINATFRKDKDRFKTRVIDTNALRNLTYSKFGVGSGDSLDRLSNYSDSSKGSVGKMTMAEVDAIVERQEQSLMMSTPKPAKSMSKLFDSRLVLPSPIQQTLQFSKEHLSDSEVSEEYSTARSSSKSKRLSMHFDSKPTNSALNTSNLNRTYKSMSNLKQHSTTGKAIGSLAVVKPTPSSANYGTYRKTSASLASARGPSAIGRVTSYERSDSERNVPRAVGSASAISYQQQNSGNSNLRTIGTNLKASYTSLRPTFANLPHAPVQGHAALRSESASAIGAARTQSPIRQTAPMKSASAQCVPAVSSNGTIVKQRLSALPRPVSGIPKPTVSKIPGPRPFRPSTAKPLTNLYYSSNTMR